MRFLGAWVTSLVAVALVAALVLGRDAPPRTYDLAAITDAFEERYASALAELEAGGVLYLRSESRSVPAENGRFEFVRTIETWVALDGDVPIAQSEESDAGGELLRKIEFAGDVQTLLVDRGAPTRESTTVQPVQAPIELLAQIRARTLGAAATGELIGAESIAGLEAARIAGPEPSTSETAFAIADPLIHLQRVLADQGESGRATAELALVEWVVLPAGTPLGTRPG